MLSGGRSLQAGENREAPALREGVRASSNRGRPTEVAYDELQHAYDHFNRRLFGGELPDCILTLQREKNTFGYFSRNRFVNRDGRKIDEIALNPSFFAVTPLLETMQTMAHEMAHLWQHHFGNPGRSRYHNLEWGRKMEAIGLMPSSTGRPGGRKTGDQVADYPIEGGRFLDAARELITDQFAISWLDRFPSAKQVMIGAQSMSTSMSAAVGGGPTPLQQFTLAAPVPEDGEELDEADAIVQPAFEASVVVVEVREPTRSRYICSCATKVWGKQGLNIICGTCRTQFQAG